MLDARCSRVCGNLACKILVEAVEGDLDDLGLLRDEIQYPIALTRKFDLGRRLIPAFYQFAKYSRA